MGQLVLQMQVTVDGFVAGPEGEHWPGSTEPVAAPMNEIPKVVFSRSASLPRVGDSATTRGLEDATRARREAGDASTNPRAAEIAESWARSRVASGDLAQEVERLKRECDKEILAHGGASFAQSLVRSGLVDEYRLLVHPAALGRGLPLFSALPTRLDLRLVSTRAFPAGTVAQVYRPA